MCIRPAVSGRCCFLGDIQTLCLSAHCLVVGLCVSSHLLQEDASLMRAEWGTDQSPGPVWSLVHKGMWWPDRKAERVLGKEQPGSAAKSRVRPVACEEKRRGEEERQSNSEQSKYYR